MSSRSRAPISLLVAGGMVAAAMGLPVVYLLLRASEAEDPLGIILHARTLRLVWDTLRLAVATTAAALVIGVGIAWLVERSDMPGRRILGVLAVLPLVVPTYVGALALLAAVGPRGIAMEIPGLIGFWGAALVLTLSTYPYVLLLTRAVLARTDPSIEEAARVLGDGSAAVFRRAVLPQLRPAMAAGGLLVFLYVLSDFGAVAILRYDTLTRAIFTEYRTTFFNRAPAAVLGVVLVALTLLAILGERRLRGRGATVPVTAGVRPPVPVGLGRWRWPAAAGVTSVIVAGIGIPVGVLTYWATVGATRTEPMAVLAAAARTSVVVSLGAAVVAVIIAVPIAVLAVRHRSHYARAVEAVSVSGYALPGLVVALALVFFTTRHVPVLYQTLTLVVIAYVVRFLPEALGAVRSSLVQVDPALEEAGRSLGRGRTHVLATVTLPLVSRGMLAGGALVFLTAMKELPATLLLRPAGHDTLAVRVWVGAAEGFYSQAAPAALLLVAVSALVVWPMHIRSRRPVDETRGEPVVAEKVPVVTSS